MSFAPQDTTLDGFLNGRLMIRQPRTGYRAATDPVFLAAAVDAKPGQAVLELGCGVGVASLCLGWRVSGLDQFGLELQPGYADLATENAKQNKIPLTVVPGDLRDMPSNLRDLAFDHIMFNPPYFRADALCNPTDPGKQTAHVEQADLRDWIDAGLKRLKPGGHIALIHLAGRLPEALAALADRVGDINIRPLSARIGRSANRVIITARKGSKTEATLLPALHIHDGESHNSDGDDYSSQAKSILRDGFRLT
ncbi:MAG: methyltransferase [Rhodobacteraceae bacterium]|nr:methyltransferase [Paracoccaceae bacterium]